MYNEDKYLCTEDEGMKKSRKGLMRRKQRKFTGRK